MRVEWQPQALDQLEAVYDDIAQEISRLHDG
jgi:hypothetical protein